MLVHLITNEDNKTVTPTTIKTTIKNTTPKITFLFITKNILLFPNFHHYPNLVFLPLPLVLP